jgi:hypothetical protein
VIGPRYVSDGEPPAPQNAVRAGDPAANPAGTTIDSAVDACVTVNAWRKLSPGSATCHGGANVIRLIAVATRSATIHSHESSVTTPQTSP